MECISEYNSFLAFGDLQFTGHIYRSRCDFKIKWQNETKWHSLDLGSEISLVKRNQISGLKHKEEALKQILHIKATFKAEGADWA